MNTQKEITITELRGKFSKDFDTFGKMDPFAEFTVGKCIARTETAEGAGKEPQWKNNIVLTYFDETVITVRCYDEDASENEYIGAGKIEVKGLRFPGGAIEVNVVTESGEAIGTLTAKYTIKNLNPVPLLLIKNVRCNFVKELTLITKSKPYFQVASEQGQVATEAKDEVRDLAITWSQVLRLRVKENSKITLSLLDKNSNGAPIFKYESNAREFKLQSGSRRFNVFDASFLYLGTLEVDFESVNLVSKEESVKNAEREKKLDAQLTSISIEKSKTDLKFKGKDVYYQFVCGTNKVQTQVLKSIPASSSFEVKRILYGEFRENKLTVLIWESNLLKDKVLAYANFPLQGLSSGDKTAPLFDLQENDMGTITLGLNIKQVPSKIMTLEAIGIELEESADMIGESEPYIVARLGGASGRTETGDKNIYNFKKAIEIKYFEENQLELQVWDEDVTNDEISYVQKVKLAELKGNKGEISFKLVKQGDTKPTAKLTFKYDLKNNAPPPEPSKKMTEKKVEAQPPPPPPKVEAPPEPKAQVKPAEESPKKEEPKKEEPKKQQMQKEEPIVPVRKPSEPKLKFEQVKQEEPPAPSKTIEVSKDSGLASQRRKTEEMNEESKLNRSLNRSIHKDSMLPSISHHQVYGDRIYDKQSAATLQKSIVAYSMPKAGRFRDEPKYSGEPTYCTDSCFKSSSMKGVGFGFGRKKQFPDWVQRNMKEIPPPGAYFDSKSDVHVKGPTFGISHKYYEKVLIPKEKPAARLPTTRKLEPIRERK